MTFGEHPRNMAYLLIAMAEGALAEDPQLTGPLRVLWDAGWAPRAQMADSQFRPIQPTFEVARPNHMEFLARLVCEYIDQTGDFSPSTEAIVAFLKAQRDRWTSPTVRHEAVVPLLQCAIDTEPLDLGDGATLSRFTPAEKEAFWSPLGNYMLSTDELRASHAKLSLLYDQARSGVVRFDSPLPAIAWAAITALRLCRAGPVGASIYHERIVGPVLHGQSGTSSLTEFLLPTHSYGEYRIESSDLSPFKAVYTAIRRLQVQGRLSGLAQCLRRFNLSYTRDHLDDRLVDLVISLEGTLLKGEMQELRYRLALRGAALLRRQAASTDTFLRLRTMYDARSKIVHEGYSLEQLAQSGDVKIPAGGYGLESYVVDCQDLVRSVLRTYVEQLDSGLSVGTVNERLDASIVSGLAP
jgi:hypothetical protein